MEQLKCTYCQTPIYPYQPGTMLVEDERGVSFSAHESCHKLRNKDYMTADEFLATVGREDED